jgi:hypothetical protein
MTGNHNIYDTIYEDVKTTNVCCSAAGANATQTRLRWT